MTTEPVPEFTDRQLEVAELLAMGLNWQEIAVRLGIGERTVKAHVHAIRLKLGVVRAREIPQALYQLGINVYPS